MINPRNEGFLLHITICIYIVKLVCALATMSTRTHAGVRSDVVMFWTLCYDVYRKGGMSTCSRQF